jgi:hypothetical protein
MERRFLIGPLQVAFGAAQLKTGVPEVAYFQFCVGWPFWT